MRISMHGKENEGIASCILILSSIPPADIPIICRATAVKVKRYTFSLDLI